MSDKDDFTRLDQLGEFLHEEDASLDALLGVKAKKKAPPPPHSNPTPIVEEEAPVFPEAPAEEPEPIIEETAEEVVEDVLNQDVEEANEEQQETFGDSFSSDDSAFGGPVDTETSDSQAENSFSSSDGPYESPDDPFQNNSEQEQQSFDPSSDLDSNSNSSDTFSSSFNEAPEAPIEEEPDQQDDLEERKLLKTPIERLPDPVPLPPPLPKEDFQDVQQYAQQVTYGKITTGGNPPFSIMIKNIKYQQDARDILIFLKEFGLADQKSEPIFKKNMESGQCLIGQIPEYAAIILVHKIRRFDLDIIMGPSEEIKSSPHFSSSKGLVEKKSIFQNKRQSQVFDGKIKHKNDILTSTNSQISEKDITKFLGIIHTHKVLSNEDILRLQDFPEHTFSQPKKIDKNDKVKEVTDQDLQKYKETFHDLYQELLEDLKQQAFLLKANAVVGIHYQLHPITIEHDKETQKMYELNCIGNAVWVC
jgi:uncharacterized protein YbjQ (UPF0145 family)